MLRRVVLWAAMVVVGCMHAKACGIDWALVKNHFDGVNEFGCVSIWRTLDKIPIGDGKFIPININFRSDRLSSSSILGYGWQIGLLESNVIQIDEKTFMLTEPAGAFRLFWRDPKNPNLLAGTGGWLAEIKGDGITAWTECGTKLTFFKGKIRSMQLGDKVFNYSYKDNIVDEVTLQGATLIKVIRDASTGFVTGLALTSDKKINLDFQNRPVVEKIGDTKVIGETRRSLGAYSVTDGNEEAFEYAVDSSVNPTVSFGKKVICWDPVNKQIVHDESWTYSVKRPTDQFMNAAIERKRPDGKTESWFYDIVHGTETIGVVSGEKIINRWFTTGKLNGKARSLERVDPKGNRRTTKMIYDESGSLLRTENSLFEGEKLVKRVLTRTQKLDLTAASNPSKDEANTVLSSAPTQNPAILGYDKKTGMYTIE